MMKSYARFTFFLAAIATAFLPLPLNAEEPPPAHLGDKLLIDPSTTGVFLSKATLTVAPLRHHDGVYSGNYEVNVSPLSIASEKGNLSVSFSDDAIRRLAQKSTVSFQGEAKNTAGKQRTIDGRATPTGSDHGDIILKIISERGKLVFHTTYHFAGN